MEVADSGEVEIDMEAAQARISEDLFPKEAEEPSEEPQEELQEEEVKEAAELKPDEKEKAEEPSEEEVKEEVKEEGRQPPSSWKKEMHEFWKGLDPAVQDYVETREEQMREGLEKDRGDANLGRVMRDVMSPYSQMLQTQGIDEPVLVRNLMNAHYRLSTADQETKGQLLHQLAQAYGVSLDGEAPKTDPAIKSLQDKIQGLEYTLNASQQRTLQESRDRVSQEVEAFAADHPFFDEVSEQIVPLINAGYSLEDAYNSAIWVNPVTRQKELDRNAKEAAERAAQEAKQEAEKALKAKSANVRGRDTRRASTEPTGTIDDTLRETFREIQSRSN